MVKTPRTRHSKSQREPVTIDLDADSVKRVPDEEQPKSQASKTEKATAAAASEKPEAEAGKTAAGPAADKTAKSREQAGAGKQTAAAAKGGGSDKSATAGGKSDEPGKEKAAEKKPAAAPSSRNTGTALAAGVAGGIVALVLAGGLQWAGILPPLMAVDDDDTAAVANLDQQMATVQEEIAALKNAPAAVPDEALGQSVNDNAARIETLAGELGTARGEIEELQSAVASGDAGDGAAVQTLTERLAAVEEQVAKLAEAPAAAEGDGQLREQIAGLTQTIQAAAETANAASTTAEANAQRLSGLEQQVAEIGQRVEASAEQPKMALVIAASALRSAVDRGDSFAGELETFAALAPDSQAVEALEPYAESGVPTRAQLARQAPNVASRIVAAAEEPGAGGGILDQLMASARSLVVVRPVGSEVEGDSVEAIAARMEAAVQDGNYDAALSEYDALPDAAKAAARGFADQLRARQTADRIVNDVLAETLKPA